MRVTAEHLDSGAAPAVRRQGRGHRQGPRRLARRRRRQGLLHRRRRRGRRRARREGHPRPQRDEPRGRPRDDGRQGILTARGGLVSHAAVVARGWGTPAVVGAEAVQDPAASRSRRRRHRQRGRHHLARRHDRRGRRSARWSSAAAEPPTEFDTILGWADAVAQGQPLGVRANADTGEDATKARELGAEGIGLCRTEHMFLAPDRLPVVRQMILADTAEEEAAALEELRKVQQADFEEILEAMDGLPVTVRLLDPPLHEFLPSVEELRIKQATAGLDDEEKALLAAAESGPSTTR